MPDTSKQKKLTESKRLADEGLVEQAWNIIEELMLEDPNAPKRPAVSRGGGGGGGGGSRQSRMALTGG